MKMFKQSWQTKINRADELAAAGDATRELLVFYGRLLRTQKRIYDALQTHRESLPLGILQEDLPTIRPLFMDLLKTIESIGTPILIEAAQAFRQSTDATLDQYLLDQWQATSATDFFAKAFLQAYARWLAESGLRPVKRNLERAENRCPICAGKPQVSCLVIHENSADGGGRDLICSTCLTIWPFRRVVCVGCGEERPSKLGYFQSTQYDYVRIEACDSCGYYLKGIDLTRFGLAVPLVDEVAAAPLDLWAREQGYQKIELNLVGL